MKVFRDLLIYADAQQMAIAISEMEKAMPSGWMRDKAAESRSQAFPSSTDRDIYCFVCKQTERRPAAMLILAEKEQGKFQVSNIVPLNQHQLKHSEYNFILGEFYDKVFKPNLEKLSIHHQLTEPDATLETWMDEKTAALLRAFTANANKWTGASHPNDRKRWNDFVLSAHQSSSTLDPSTLVRWLVEEENWSAEVAEQLALEYESGRGLLEHAYSH